MKKLALLVSIIITFAIIKGPSFLEVQRHPSGITHMLTPWGASQTCLHLYQRLFWGFYNSQYETALKRGTLSIKQKEKQRFYLEKMKEQPNAGLSRLNLSAAPQFVWEQNPLLTQAQKKAIIRVSDVLDDAIGSFKHLQDLDSMLIKMKNEIPLLNTRDSLNYLLQKIEKKHGFNQPVEMPKIMADPEDFFKSIKNKNPIIDRAFKKEVHGEMTHRLQWYIIMKDFELNPSLYQTRGWPNNVSEVYALFAQEKLRNFNLYGFGSAWDMIFDAGRGSHSLHSPEEFNLYLKNRFFYLLRF